MEKTTFGRDGSTETMIGKPQPGPKPAAAGGSDAIDPGSGHINAGDEGFITSGPPDV